MAVLQTAPFPLQLYFYSKVTIRRYKHSGEHCEMHYTIKHWRSKNNPIWINSKYLYDSKCYYQVWKPEFQNVTPIVPDVFACDCFAYVALKEKTRDFLWWVFTVYDVCVLQQPWATTSWRTQYYRLAPAPLRTTLCWLRASPRPHLGFSTPLVSFS